MALKNKILSVKNAARSAVLIASFGMALTVSELSHAQTTPCDPAYMQALEARAWLEMNREITQNQNLIAKPDSVLEYTCFNQFLNEVADNPGSGRPFSETDRWGTISGFSPTSTDTSLSQVVGFAFNTYLTANFAHDYLGGRAVGDNYAPTAAVTGGAYGCAEMATVWQVAKCTDFFEYGNRGIDPNRDGFMDFNWYRSNDPRNLPPSMVCPAPTALYDRAINTAFNDSATNRSAARYILPAGSEADFSIGGSYDVDNVVTHLDFILYQGHPLAGTCQTIQTGITVDRVAVTPYPDAICPNPGCHLVRSGGSSSCQP